MPARRAGATVIADKVHLATLSALVTSPFRMPPCALWITKKNGRLKSGCSLPAKCSVKHNWPGKKAAVRAFTSGRRFQRLVVENWPPVFWPKTSFHLPRRQPQRL